MEGWEAAFQPQTRTSLDSHSERWLAWVEEVVSAPDLDQGLVADLGCILLPKPTYRIAQLRVDVCVELEESRPGEEVEEEADSEESHPLHNSDLQGMM